MHTYPLNTFGGFVSDIKDVILSHTPLTTAIKLKLVAKVFHSAVDRKICNCLKKLSSRDYLELKRFTIMFSLSDSEELSRFLSYQKNESFISLIHIVNLTSGPYLWKISNNPKKAVLKYLDDFLKEKKTISLFLFKASLISPFLKEKTKDWADLLKVPEHVLENLESIDSVSLEDNKEHTRLQYFKLLNLKSRALLFTNFKTELKKIAENNVPEAQMDVALGDENFDTKALEKVSSVYSEAYYYLGRIFSITDENKALDFYKRGAILNDPGSQYKLAKLYFKGKGVKQDIPEGIRLYFSSAKQKYLKALVKIGTLIKEGSYFKKDLDLALKWLEYPLSKGMGKAVKLLYEWAKSHPQARYELSKYLSKQLQHKTNKEVGVDFNDHRIKKIQDLYQEAAYLEHTESQFCLGMYYLSRDIHSKEGFEWIKMAALKNHTKAQFLLTNLLIEGNGCDKNPEEAFRWCTLSARQNDPEAQLKLAEIYYGGIGASVNYQESFKWMFRAARNRQVGAQFKLGLYYELGKMGEKDLGKAKKWFALASEMNDSQATTHYLYLLYPRYKKLTLKYAKAKISDDEYKELEFYHSKFSAFREKMAFMDPIILKDTFAHFRYESLLKGEDLLNLKLKEHKQKLLASK